MNPSKLYKTIFKMPKPIIGMIHLSGPTPLAKTKRAMAELLIYQEEGLAGAIVEDYHGSKQDVLSILKEIKHSKFDIKIGINLLCDPYASFELASEFGAQFIQFDSVQRNSLNIDIYNNYRKNAANIAVFGGVRR